MFSAKDLIFTKKTGGYTISRSLRFRSSASAYLSRTLTTPTNRNKWTWSGWIKRGAISGAAEYRFFASSSTSTNTAFIGFNNDTLRYYNRSSSSTNIDANTTAVFRDPSAWYHVVVVYDSANATAASRLLFYINGVSYSTGVTVTLNQNSEINVSGVDHYIGVSPWNTSTYFDGYLAEVNFIDGQALTPSSFGETDATTGVWKPKAYSGTYGTNGFYLKFTDVGSTTAGGANTGYGKDFAGTNNWTTNNFGTATTPASSAVSYDSMIDTPTPYDDDGVYNVGNYCVLNPTQNSTDTAATITNGNLTIVGSGATYPNCSTTFSPEGLKGYFEFTITGNDCRVGFISATTNPLATDYTNAAGYSLRLDNGNLLNANATVVVSGYLGAGSSGDVYGCAFDFTTSSRKVWFHRNGTWGTNGSVGNPAAGTNAGFTSTQLTAAAYRCMFLMSSTATTSFNFGQRPFTHTPPTGFKALNTQNLAAGSITTSGSFTGNGSTDGPFVWLNGVPTAMTINGNAVTFATHADKLANGFKVRSSSSSYNVAGSNTYSITTTGVKFKDANAQGNP